MKTRVAATATLGAALLSGPAPSNAANEPLATRPGLELGVQAARYRYEEPGFMKLLGNRGGLMGAYTFTNSRGAFSRIEIRESYGRLKFQGPTGTSSNIPDLILETRVVGGMDFPTDGRFSLSPYLGIGLRYLYNDLRGYDASNAAVGYRRESTYAYLPLGVTARMRLGDQWLLAPSLEADAFIRGRQTSRLSDLGTGTSDVMNSQNRGRGYRAYLMFEKNQWSLGGWMHYWRVRDSDAQAGGVYQPENWTRESGLEVRYRF